MATSRADTRQSLVSTPAMREVLWFIGGTRRALSAATVAGRGWESMRRAAGSGVILTDQRSTPQELAAAAPDGGAPAGARRARGAAPTGCGALPERGRGIGGLSKPIAAAGFPAQAQAAPIRPVAPTRRCVIRGPVLSAAPAREPDAHAQSTGWGASRGWRGPLGAPRSGASAQTAFCR